MTEGKIVSWLKNVGDKVSLLLFMPGDLVGVSFNSCAVHCACRGPQRLRRLSVTSVMSDWQMMVLYPAT
jgi:hypothetical protein